MWRVLLAALEYETHKLAFLMDATVTASVLFHGFKTYPFTFNIKNYYIKVDNTVEYDRSLCNCTQMMQGKRPPPSKPVTVASLPRFDTVREDEPLGSGDKDVLTLPEIGTEGKTSQ